MKKKLENIQIAYIGGGSKEWARVFMGDLALAGDISGTIRLFDIDIEEAKKNAIIGAKLSNSEIAISKWEYNVYDNIEEALLKVDFVIISILPGTFEEMRSDVHTPEKYGIYQPVGDSVGPGGVLRALRTVPIYEDFAKAIEKYCPKAWVFNLTNPMSLCVKTLYDIFPKIKAFGCCHEVFNAQKFLLSVVNIINKIDNIKRQDIYTNVMGINHFTWINEARYKKINILDSLREFIKEYYYKGYNADGETDAFLTNPNKYGNRVKMDLFKKYGVLAAAGDRHLVEFLPSNWYLKDKDMVKEWMFSLTTVDFRINKQNNKIKDTKLMIEGKIPCIPKKSREEVVDMMKALLGLSKIVTNVNLPNYGQIEGLKKGGIVETNAIFSNDCVKPIMSGELPSGVCNLITREFLNQESLYRAIKNRNLKDVFNVFINEALCDKISIEESKKLFIKMIENTKSYLHDYYDLSTLDDF